MRGTALETVRLKWENGLLAISERLVDIEGQVSAIPIGTHGRRTMGALRGTRGTALAFFRQPARTNAAIASPAIHPA